MNNGHGPSTSSSTELAEVKKEAAKVTKKLNEVNERLENLDSQFKLAMYGGIALLSINFLQFLFGLFF